MSNESIHQLAEKHKKFMEKVDIFPYKYKNSVATYEMAHFYRLSANLYGSFLYSPYHLSYEEVKDVFYSFILLDEYMKNKISKLNDYASMDYTDSYYGFREDLKNTLLKDERFEPVLAEIESIIKSIDFVEESFAKNTMKYDEYQKIISQIKAEGIATEFQLKEMRRILGMCHVIEFEHTLEQKKLLDPLKELYTFMKQNQLADGDLKTIFQKAHILLYDKSVIELDNSLKRFGGADENSALSYEELVEKFINMYEKDFFKALNEDFIKRRVRNPSVQKAK
ncbi:hypothetical protein [Falsibacillus pallidus]|uniref:hypothetical protein n=1 Tax=Falsibacillus pallidus TaxID=493781 RepID=UPI003D978B39